MIIRCKFKCTEVTKTAGWKVGGPLFLYAAKFTAVMDDAPENKDFFEATPFGSLTIGTIKHDIFDPGMFYYLNIIPVPEKPSQYSTEHDLFFNKGGTLNGL